MILRWKFLFQKKILFKKRKEKLCICEQTKKKNKKKWKKMWKERKRELELEFFFHFVVDVVVVEWIVWESTTHKWWESMKVKVIEKMTEWMWI